MRPYVLSLALLIPLALPSCSGEKESSAPLRNEYITVYDEARPDVSLDDVLLVPIRGVDEGKLHVKTNANVKMTYSDGGTGWLTIKSVDEMEPGHSVITYSAPSMIDGNSLEQRSGNLSFTAPDIFLGKFLGVRQGYQQVWEESFSDYPSSCVQLTGKDTWTTPEIAVVATHYYDYVSFNAWATASGDITGRNITLDVTVLGGAIFSDINRRVYRINVPLGNGPEGANLRWLLLSGSGERLSSETRLSFSVHNPSGVSVSLSNVRVYKVTESEIEDFWDDDEEFNDDESGDGDDWI